MVTVHDDIGTVFTLTPDEALLFWYETCSEENPVNDYLIQLQSLFSHENNEVSFKTISCS